MPSDQTVRIFHGDGVRYASAVFQTEPEALSWAKNQRVSGLLTEYPVGDGSFHIALKQQMFKPSKPHHGTPEHVASFSPGWTRHIHLIDGDPDS